MIGRLAIALAAVTLAAATAPPHRLMQWPDLLSRPLPQATTRIAYGPDPAQFAELWLPAGAGPHPVVVMIHGGCWRYRVAKLTIMNYIADDLRRRGVAVWNIEYRGADQPGGGYPGTFLDVAAAADALRAAAVANHLSLKRVVVVGHSAGGHLGAWLAARPRMPAASPLAAVHPLPIAAVVSLGGLPDLKADQAAGDTAACGAAVIDALTGPVTDAHRDVFADTSPAERLPLGVRQVVVNGDQDPIAPPSLGRAYADRVRAARDPVTLTVLPNTGHVELISPGSAAWSRAAALIVRLTR